MIINIRVEGKELLTGRLQAETDDFLKKTEALYASVLMREGALPQTCKSAEVSLSIVDPDSIRKLNLSYRDMDTPTDILSFPLWEENSRFAPPPDWECLPLGDIVICPDKISEHAGENNKSFIEELVLVMSHGLLHLIGYDHFDNESERKMWMEQDRMVEQFFREEGAGSERS
ncbi:MAG: rRNA maturation RNase YbeY [Synergistaceae bacterium]|nr:rRNA maturation RNase YbeY [Synergistaceae bacterium]